MEELEKQYNKDVKKPANFSLHRPSYMAGGRAALKWVLEEFSLSPIGNKAIREELGDT